MDIEWCWSPEDGLPAPDAVFILNLSEAASLKRGGFGEERYELSNFQAKVRHNYKLLKDSKLWKVWYLKALPESKIKLIQSFNLENFISGY